MYAESEGGKEKITLYQTTKIIKVLEDIMQKVKVRKITERRMPQMKEE